MCVPMGVERQGLIYVYINYELFMTNVAPMYDRISVSNVAV